MSKLINQISAVFVITIVIACSIVQYHHHDDYQHICVYTFNLQQHEHHEHEHICLHHKHDDGDSHDEMCSLHLSVCNDTAQNILAHLKAAQSTVTFLFAVLTQQPVILDNCECGSNVIYARTPLPTEGHNLSPSLRAPPAFY